MVLGQRDSGGVRLSVADMKVTIAIFLVSMIMLLGGQAMAAPTVKQGSSAGPSGASWVAETSAPSFD